MSLWWLERGWEDACCANCGINIWKDGSDPDWGYCLNCFNEKLKNKYRKSVVQTVYEEYCREENEKLMREVSE